MNRIRTSLLLTAPALLLTQAPTALASTTWYVNGVNGSDHDNCMSSQAACKTIGHAVSLAASGDSMKVAAATYTENLTIGFSLNVIGSGASTTIIDGGGAGRVVTISNASIVTLSNVTIRNGRAPSGTVAYGGGVYNNGTLTINNSTVSGNYALSNLVSGIGGGIANWGILTINSSTVSGNYAISSAISASTGYGRGGGIYNIGELLINNSTVSGNEAFGRWSGYGGGIYNIRTLTINSSTLSGNTAGCGYLYGCQAGGGGIDGGGTINNSTVASNSAFAHLVVYSEGGGIRGGSVISNSTVVGNVADRGGGIYGGGPLQNSIVANNRTYVFGSGANCYYHPASSIFSLSSDNSCNLNGPGDLNNTDPKLGTLGNYGGPTQTIPLLSRSPAIDAGNPSGCTDDQGQLLKTDQRGVRRPDNEDRGGCDMGAYESQSD
jgi:hypothetical protein